MIRTTPFHERTSALNETGLWEHWSGHLAAVRYQMSEKFEYFAIRNAAGLFDTSPLYKYRFTGPDAGRFLGGVLARDPAQVPRRQGPVHAVVRRPRVRHRGRRPAPRRRERVPPHRRRAEPRVLRVARRRPGRLDRGRLERLGDPVRPGPALARPRRRGRAEGRRARLLRRRAGRSSRACPCCSRGPATRATSGSRSGSRRRCAQGLGRGLEGQPRAGRDPVRHDRAVHGPDRGRARPARRRLPLEPVRLDGRRPVDADRARAGLDVPRPRAGDERLRRRPAKRSATARTATTARSSARDAIRRELADKTSRWQLTGLVVDWRDYDRIYDGAGLIPPKDHTPLQDEYYVYDDELNQLGYATSQMYSPMLQRHIALARVPLDRTAPGSRVKLEMAVSHRYEYFDAHVTRLPLFNPQRRTA